MSLSQEAIVEVFRKAKAPIDEDAIGLIFEFVNKYDINEEDFEIYVETYSCNERNKSFTYKQVLGLISMIKADEGFMSRCGDLATKRDSDKMSPPITPLKKQRFSASSQMPNPVTPASGKVYEVSDSPGTRHNESPKTYPTPVKNEQYKNRKERLTSTIVYDSLDEAICEPTAPHLAVPAVVEIEKDVGVKSSERIVPAGSCTEEIQKVILESRRAMSTYYQKEFTGIRYDSIGSVCVSGMVYFDVSSSSVLKDSSIFVVDEEENRLSLCCHNLQDFVLFPGQMIGVEGEVRNRRIDITALYDGYDVKERQITKTTNPNSIQIMAVRGPYSSKDDDLYEQLKDFVAYCKESKPNLILFFGPFVSDENSSSTLLFSSFKEKVSPLMSSLSSTLLFIPSVDDAIAQPVFPQPPYLKSKYMKLTAGNPSVITMKDSDLRIGVVNSDIMMDMMKKTYRSNSSSTADQYLRELLKQKSLYPLYPTSLPFDETKKSRLYYQGDLDILIIATDKQRFIKEIDGVLCIATGALSMGNSGGTFAKLEVFPLKEDYCNQTEGTMIPNRVVKRTKAEIIKI